MISADDWNETQSDVSDEELEAAAGGRFKVKSITERACFPGKNDRNF